MVLVASAGIEPASLSYEPSILTVKIARSSWHSCGDSNSLLRCEKPRPEPIGDRNIIRRRRTARCTEPAIGGAGWGVEPLYDGFAGGQCRTCTHTCSGWSRAVLLKLSTLILGTDGGTRTPNILNLNQTRLPIAPHRHCSVKYLGVNTGNRIQTNDTTSHRSAT